MSEREDDTTETQDEAQGERGRGSYYYDDSTGYEIYAPDEDEERELPANGAGKPDASDA